MLRLKSKFRACYCSEQQEDIPATVVQKPSGSQVSEEEDKEDSTRRSANSTNESFSSLRKLNISRIVNTINVRKTKDAKHRIFPKGCVDGLRVLHTPEHSKLDIVFVHGLNGSSFETWFDAATGTYWPTMLLPKDIPDAQIITFGYDATAVKFIGPISQNDLRDHANNLIADMTAQRIRDGSVCCTLQLQN